MEFQSSDALDLIETKMLPRLLTCAIACNQERFCRTFDYDSTSHRCRLFESDINSGSIVPSISDSSVVGTIHFTLTSFSQIYNKSCSECQFNRYGTCSPLTNTCQCLPGTYWNGTYCLKISSINQSCSEINSCPSNMNLTCSMDCYGANGQCVPNQNLSDKRRAGITIAGSCDGKPIGNNTVLKFPNGIFLMNNKTMLVTDNNKLLMVFNMKSRQGTQIRNYSNWVSAIFFDNRTSLIYATVTLSSIVRIWPTNAIIPPSGATGACDLQKLYYPTGIAVDSSGRVYIASSSCNWVTRWGPNDTIGTLVAGSATAVGGSGNQDLSIPESIILDESRSHLYVCDQFNHRVQRFTIGSPIGVTVAGGNGQGVGSNQLYRPFGIALSPLDRSLFIADTYNNRVQKWAENATSGTTVAGNMNGVLGNSNYELNQPFSIVVDPDGLYFYVSDQSNNRIQRYPTV